ncbi:MAG TPA: hypothetical protein VKQ54_13060 [Caulobacteraceae bacterium]|nr:hypothetical protein [Caulobacteraceae bacterium]
MRRAAIKALVPTAIACLALGTALPAMVMAQEAIPTAPGAAGGDAPPAPESGPLRLSDRIDEGPDVLRPVGPCGGPARKEDGKLDKTPHGEVWAGIGTHGYREIGGVVCAPLGDNAAVSLAIDAGHLDGWGRRR